MAKIEAPTMRNQMTAGSYGDANKAHMFVDLSAAAVGDVVDLARFGAGTRHDDMKIVHGALGAGVTAKVGYRYVDAADGTDDDDYFKVTTAMSSAGTLRSDSAPIEIAAPHIITLTVVAATTSATGRVDLVGDNVYNGPN
jgi:hypothetical protein